ncbi:putative membrane protein [Clostridium sp. CAG:349]|nr:putative membrane protein [Clostridium sp. CAG:349]
MFYTSLGWFNGFNPDSWVMYLMYALIVVFISAEAIFYLVKSVKKAKKIGMDMTKIKKVIKTSASFSVLPAIGIGIGVVTLIGSLGITVPAIRLSVIGALQYETQMADGAAKAITGSTDGLTLLIQRGVTAQDYATIVTLMTVAIIAGPILVVLFYKKLQPKLAKLGAMKVGGSVDPDAATKNLESDAKKANPNGINLGDLAFQVSFIGMIIGYIAMSIGAIAAMPGRITSYYNFIAVIVAALFMVLSDFLVKKLNWKWLDDFSVAFSMLFAMLVVGVISGTTGQF